MPKNKNTFEKRRREMNRMQKAQEKRERRFARRKGSAGAASPDGAAIEQPAPIDDQSVPDASI